MGQHEILPNLDDVKRAEFMRSLLSDMWAIERMLDTNQFESGIRRIGAEQEVFLVDHSMRPAPIASSILKNLNDPRFSTELGKFNLEINLTPQVLNAGCFLRMEQELTELIAGARGAAAEQNSDLVLTGILPTIDLSDLTLENMSDSPRYHELNRTLNQLRGSKFHIHIKGLDEIELTHDNMMIEACNTSFQVHLQIDPRDCVDMYNLAQAVTAPVLAAAVNSPLLFGKRLWSETRLALFQHSVDDRSEVEQGRSRTHRVTFGDRWLLKSPLEIFRDDIARFRVLFTHEADEDPAKVLERGEVPKLSALRLHNGTVWRWNRLCYGIMDGQAHLRIENRVLPSGPSILDEVSNAAFYVGLMSSLKEEYGPIDRVMDFESAKSNFFAAARHGLNAHIQWIMGRSFSAGALILEHLLPLARVGLNSAGLTNEEVDRYLNVIEERVRSGQTGAQWTVKGLASMAEQGTAEIRRRALTAAMIQRETEGTPVHRWPYPQIHELEDVHQTYRTVSQFMSTDLFTVRPDDIVDFAASIMHWQHIRHLPVEDEQGHLVGLISQRNLLQLLAQGSTLNRAQGVPVHRIMKRDPITVNPETPTLEAIELLRKNKIGCLPVLKKEKLVGIVTLFDLLTISAKLFEVSLKK